MLEETSSYSFEICVDNKWHATNRIMSNYFSEWVVA